MTATNKRIPGKRLKTWHRHYRKDGGGMSLLQFARGCLRGNDEERDIAMRWARGKVAP